MIVWLVVLLPLLHCAGSEAAEIGGGKPSRRIAFGSCHSQLREGIFEVLSSFQPDQLLLLGDNIYVDTKKLFGFQPATPEDIAGHYCTLNGDLSWQRLVGQLGGFDSVFATWDDHDYGVNDGDSSYQYKKESKGLFLDFFRVSADSPRRARDGVYDSSVHELRGDHGARYTYKIITLDTRYNLVSQRSGSREPDMLGAAQWAWLEAELADPDVDIIFLGSSVQILPTDKLILESWHFHDPKGRDRLLSLVTGAPCPNVILLSGDVHEAEISQATCLNGSRKLYELTSSGFTHSFAYRSRLIDTEPLIRRGCPEGGQLDRFELASPQARDNAVGKFSPPVDVHERGWLFTQAHRLYEATFPAHFRAHRFGHHYGSLHFSLLDIFLAPSDNASTSLGYVQFSVINHVGERVMSYDVPLLKRSSCPANAAFNEPKYNERESTCIPYWGPVPLYKEYLLQFCLVTPLIVFGLLPALAVCWLLCASIYYIFWVSELKRREKIEATWKQIKKVS